MIPPVTAERVNGRRTQSAQRPQRSHFSWRPWRPWRSLFVVCLALLPTPLSAHDLEKTQVLITFERDGSFVVDVANDPEWLKLRLASFPGPFADRVVLWVDGREIRPAAAELVPGATLATERLRGRMPADARVLRWYYGLVADPYPLTIRRADGRVIVEEVQGDAWSREIDLSGQVKAPLMSGSIATALIAALLLVPLALRFGTSTKDTEVTKGTKEKRPSR
jgi:hypothetical protein